MKKGILLLSLIMFFFKTSTSANYEKKFYDFSIESITGETINFKDYKNKIILVVNTASYCGFTKQYDELQELWDLYKEKGLIVLGVPSNSFNQEKNNNTDIKEFCEVNYGITFPVMSKVKIRGKNKHPFFLWIENNYGLDKLPKWNFFKYLITKEGQLVKVFSSRIKPDSSKFIEEIEKYL